jgi:hypothetical protein
MKMRKFTKMVEHSTYSNMDDTSSFAKIIQTLATKKCFSVIPTKIISIMREAFDTTVFIKQSRKLREGKLFSKGLQTIKVPYIWYWIYLPYHEPLYTVESESGLTVMAVYNHLNGLFVVIEFYHDNEQLIDEDIRYKWKQLTSSGFDVEEIDVDF